MDTIEVQHLFMAQATIGHITPILTRGRWADENAAALRQIKAAITRALNDERIARRAAAKDTQ